MQDVCFLGKTTFRNQERKFGIRTDDRRRHTYIIGKTGMGKTALLKNMAVQDIRNGKGVGFVDPHGEAAEDILNFIPKERIKDVVYFNPADFDYPIAFNVMEQVEAQYRHLVASGLMGVFKKIWPDVWSARMEYILNNSILALLEYPGSTLLGINRLLADSDYRSEVVENITDPVVKSFWLHEFARYTQRLEVEATAAIQNKIGQFISSPVIRNIVGQKQSSIDIRKCMDEGKILIVNLSKGRIGEDTSKLLGGLVVTKLQLAAMSRVDILEEERKDFFLYVDEFQNFATESFVSTLSEARKYRLALTLSHQYISQMEENVRDAVFGNVGTMISFRVGAEDGEVLEKEFYPDFTVEDFVNLPKYNIYLKLMIDGVTSKPFSAKTFPPVEVPSQTFPQEIIESSREKYTNKREEVEKEIAKWTGDFVLSQNQKEESSSPKLYDAQCDNCNKWIKVPFKPDPNRKVYCKSCLKKIKGDGQDKEETKENENKKGSEEKSGSSRTLTLEQLLTESPVSFGGKKKQEDKDSKRSEVNKKSLKETLKKALGKSSEENENKEDKNERGEINPGEKVDL